jgi:hypothetical protein
VSVTIRWACNWCDECASVSSVPVLLAVEAAHACTYANAKCENCSHGYDLHKPEPHRTDNCDCAMCFGGWKPVPR